MKDIINLKEVTLTRESDLYYTVRFNDRYIPAYSIKVAEVPAFVKRNT